MTHMTDGFYLKVPPTGWLQTASLASAQVGAPPPRLIQAFEEDKGQILTSLPHAPLFHSPALHRPSMCVCVYSAATHTLHSWLPQCWINALWGWGLASPVLPSSPDGPELVALAPPTPPPFIKAGSDFNLTCSAVSSPDATFQWFRDQQLMEASGSVLTLKTLQEHSGASAAAQYWCGATNSKTRRTLASTPVSFAVIGEPRPLGLRRRSPWLRPSARPDGKRRAGSPLLLQDPSLA